MRTPLNTFYNMKYRCYNPKDKHFTSYGGSGITICDQWLKNKVSFVTWSEENGWAPGKHIHRKDNSKGYSPDNCEWLTPDEHRKLHMTSPNRITPVLYPPGSISAMAATLGRKGGSVKSERKAAASRENGKKGGKPRKEKT